MRRLLFFLAAIYLAAAAAPVRDDFHFALIGDRTGEAVPGIYEQVLKIAANGGPAFLLNAGDSIQGLNDATAENEWREFQRLTAPLLRVSLYFTPGNHDIWSPDSERLYVRHSGHPVRYGFDHAQAHFTILDNSRTDALSESELAFLEEDLKAHAAQPVKFIVSHRPSWLIDVMLRNPDFPLHRIARKYGVKYVIAGHIHQMVRLELDGVAYLSLPSAGGHLRASGKYEDGWFFGYIDASIQKNEISMRVHELNGRETPLQAWGAAGLIAR